MASFLMRMQQSKVDWRTAAGARYTFETVFEATPVLLRLNDFPEEALCTVIVDDHATDLDDFPKTWTLPHHRGEA